jgi:hypothetical protein
MATETQHEAREILQICAWCLPRTIRILGQPIVLAPGAKLEFEIDGKTGCPIAAWTTADGRLHEYKLSHGICPECAAKFHRGPGRAQ